MPRKCEWAPPMATVTAAHGRLQNTVRHLAPEVKARVTCRAVNPCKSCCRRLCRTVLLAPDPHCFSRSRLALANQRLDPSRPEPGLPGASSYFSKQQDIKGQQRAPVGLVSVVTISSPAGSLQFHSCSCFSVPDILLLSHYPASPPIPLSRPRWELAVRNDLLRRSFVSPTRAAGGCFPSISSSSSARPP